MDYSLSNDDIGNYLNNRIKVVTYKDLYNFNSIDDLLSPFGVIALLFETRPGNGHWTILFKRNNQMIEFFDSYGLVVDDELKFVNSKYKNMLRENYKYLTKLIYDSPYELEYNPHHFQKLDGNVNTCGRWIILRYIYKSLTIDEFFRVIKDISKEFSLSPDELVVKLIEI